jgi:hypothetical protein
MTYWPGISDELKALLERKPIPEGRPDGPDWNTKAVIEEMTQFMQTVRWLDIVPIASWIELFEKPDVLQRIAPFQNAPLLKEFLDHVNQDGRFVAFLKEAMKLREAARKA